MAYNGAMIPPSKSNPPPKSLTPTPVLKFFNTPSLQTFYSPPPPLWLEMAASTFFTHAYYQQAHVNISEAIITD